MMNNKEQIARWRTDDETWSMARAAGATGEMLDMLEQQQAQIEQLSQEILENYEQETEIHGHAFKLCVFCSRDMNKEHHHRECVVKQLKNGGEL